MPRCLPPVHICTERKPAWCLCFGLHRGTFTWSQDIVRRSCGYASTQKQSVRRATTDRCHPVVRPCTPGGEGGDNQTSKVVFLSSVGLVFICHLFSCFAGTSTHMNAGKKTVRQIDCWICLLVFKLRWHISTRSKQAGHNCLCAPAKHVGIRKYFLQYSILSASLYANTSFATRDKYTWTKPGCRVLILQGVVRLKQ